MCYVIVCLLCIFSFGLKLLLFNNVWHRAAGAVKNLLTHLIMSLIYNDPALCIMNA